ncbi:MAG: aldo/keto reductase [Bryobacteraceae bacterium]|nr:aldo/keto reductase [Bryobacteraceae bacterium]
MQTKKLGNSDLHITPIGIGAWAMGGGGWQFGWGPQDDDASVRAIHAALDAGLNWIDTAAVYGLGHGEEVVGRALEGLSRKPYVFTKCARVWGEDRQIGKSLKRESVRRECEESLRRLKVDVIDLYQMHWPEPDEEVEEGWETLVRLKEEGKVRWIGVSNFSTAHLERITGIETPTSLQPPYNILRREIESDQLRFCRANNVGVLVYSPMQSGLLSGRMSKERLAAMPDDDHRQRTPYFQEPQFSRNLALVELMRAIGARHGRTPGEVAISWTLRLPEITGAIVGIRSVEQVEGVIGAAEFRLAEGEIAELEGFLAANPV